MNLQRLRAWLLAALALCALLPALARADDFLEPEQAFQLKAELVDKAVLLHWTIAPGYHLYRDQLRFTADAASAPFSAPALPDGIRKFDVNFNKELESYERTLDLRLPLQAATPFNLTVVFQGCADAGLCYAPMQQVLRVDPAMPGALATAPAAAPASAPAAPAAATPAPQDDSSLAQRTLESGSIVKIGAAFLVFGLLLSFTPCVLPMVPILSSIIVGEGNVTRSRGLLLALAYSLGMALVYTSLGVGAGLAGEGLAGALQKPWVLLCFGGLMVVLALSMFDVYQLQLPSSIQSRLSAKGAKGGRAAGVFVMGALSALIVGPCVAGPLAGALLYISQTGNAATGGWALFSMAAGMSVPLLLTGLSAGSLLPRAGAWMNGVKKVFGLLLIAVAVWMVTPVFPVPVMMVLWGSLAIACALFLHVGQPLPPHSGVGAYARKALGVVLMVGGLFELAGAASGGQAVVQPLAHLRGGGAVAAVAAAPQFTRVASVAELERALAQPGPPAMLDFYADWCVACKEMEHMTFSDPKVAAAMKSMRLLQVDVTANSDEQRALLKKFNLFGPPGIVLFGASGKEINQGRVIGFVPPDTFLRHLARARDEA